MEHQFQQRAQPVTQPLQPQQQHRQHQHSRGDSMYSMDSFVAELPEIPERVNQTESDRFDYISPSSSSAVSIDSRKISGKFYREQELRTINTSSLSSRSYSTDADNDYVKSKQDTALTDRDTNSADAQETVIAPVHSFFNQPYFQVDADDNADGGSIVFKNTQDASQSQTTQAFTSGQQNLPKQSFARDRLPSFESVGSSGSLVWKMPSKGSSKPPTPASPSAPKILPYHERRKLLEQRQKQQHQRPQGSKMENIPSKPDKQVYSSLQNSTLIYKDILTESSMLRQPHPQFGNAIVHYPEQQIPLPYSGITLQHLSTPNFYGPAPQGNVMQPQMTSNISNARTAIKAGASLAPQSSHFIHNRPPIQPSFQNFASSSILENAGVFSQTKSSFDSFDETGFGKDISGMPMNPAFQPPPPPPPPPPLKAAHIRKDSTGSVSSLGSVERSSREDDAEHLHSSMYVQQHLNPWPPKEPLLPNSSASYNSRLHQVFHDSKRSAHVPIQVGQRTTMTSGNIYSAGVHHRSNSSGKGFQGEKRQRQITPSSGSNMERIRPNFATHNIPGPLPASSLANPLHQSTIKSGREYGKSELSVVSSSNTYSSDETDDDEGLRLPSTGSFARYTEASKLLPPTGISSNEYYDRKYIDYGERPHRSRRHKNTRRAVNEIEILRSEQLEGEEKSRKRNRKKAKRHRRKKKRNVRSGDSSQSSSTSSASVSSHNYQQWMQTRANLLENDRQQFLKQWRAEVRAEESANRKLKEENMLHKRCCRYVGIEAARLSSCLSNFFSWLEAFFANFPIMIGAVAYAFANLGQDWSKAIQERTGACQPVHFHSVQCTFPEFPGCFYCDTNSVAYKVSLDLHLFCSALAGLLAFTFLSKLIIARNVFLDELSNPISIAPAGLLFMTLSVAFAGRGELGMWIVLISSSLHLCLSLWFVYMALAYRLLPDPSWFPNTVGIGICAVKTWLYYPVAGRLLMAVSLSLNFFFYPISLVRVGFNEKISATVGWMLMSAPNVSLYALTIMAQPSFVEEEPDINNYQKVHRLIYFPYMHFLFGLCITGMFASINSLRVRWSDFCNTGFSAAHVTFCFPIASHATAIQAYRAAIISFSDFPADGIFRRVLYCYWLTVLSIGTVITLFLSSWFFLKLPKWTHVDVLDELEPPLPNDTLMQLSDMISVGETLVQPYVSPAVLQVNETGALTLVRNVEGQRYIRSRRVSAIGFEPLLSNERMNLEREILLDWIGKNPHRRKHRTLSVPGIDFNYQSTVGVSQANVYGMEESSGHWIQRPRSDTPPVSRKISQYSDKP